MTVTLPAPRPLPEIAAHVDNELAALDARIDWLLALSPIHNDLLWQSFEASGRSAIPELHYPDLPLDLAATRERLHALPVQEVESSLLSALLSEKQRELERQLELIRLRGSRGFINASLDLFGGVEPTLLALAREIMESVPPGAPLPADAGIDEVLQAVNDELAWYRRIAPDLDCEVVVDPDLGSLMMVSHGRFYVDANIRLPRARIQPLVQHEIGTHVLTRHNGGRQPLKQLQVGLAHYDPLQEGLGVLAEYLAGYLPGERLQVLAARVIACDMAIHGKDVPEIFDLLHRVHGMATDDAFDVAVRARRGGGLTKDAVYLRGLRDLIDYLHEDGDLAALYIGKFALTHLVVLEQLIEQGWAVPAQMLPRCLSDAAARQRLQECRSRPVQQLFHKEPCA
ncbi:flavohemoglobin expression-modulating QEGLA motif protein [Pseudoxanthomonas dokdonensis]|uniref:DUF1704 domain-containing protein n=1 Tax=Pseudoxanthomonas dokdonensis TaxID=344882 RepID=A0A0R0CYQ3_9GAMM|nr:tyrosine/phenylalanine carboxypeptidase domain-containing protein [Pseudoxanthomonas dokdonensis]KRG70499.1 hypothetical protein ABB29_05305 [Pseudoxanthomonas dokdonensis]